MSPDKIEYPDSFPPFPSPTPATLLLAKTWLAAIRLVLEREGLTYAEPHETSSSVGEAVFEWWVDRKTLTLYVGDTEVEYIRSWGRSVTKEMDDGTLRKADEFVPLWRWLHELTDLSSP